MMKFSRYLLYLQLSRLNKEFLMRFNFIMEASGSLCFFVLHIVMASFIISKFAFPGWSEAEYWVLISTFQLFSYLSFFLLWRGINWTYRDIHNGGFDFILVKPGNSRMLAFLRGGSSNNFVSIICSLLFLLFIFSKYSLTSRLSLFTLLAYIFFIVCSLWINHCLDVIFISLNFKYGKIEETKGPIYTVQEALKYPVDLFTNLRLSVAILTVPVALLTSVPASILLLKPLSPTLGLSYFAIFFLVTLGSIYMWKWGVKNYTSAS